MAELEEAASDEQVLAATAELTMSHRQLHDMLTEKARLKNQVKDAENEISPVELGGEDRNR
ncbi:hypothetical protein ACWEKT_35425 [Nocardia takedensis]